MTTTHTYKGIVWIDLDSPNEEEISGLVKRYALHPLVGEELKTSSTVAKVDFYSDYALVVLTLPSRVGEIDNHSIVDREVDFVIGKNFLITSHFDSVDALEYFAKVFDTNSILDKNEKIEHAGHLFYYLVKKIYTGMKEDIENIRDSIISAESKVFQGQERQMVKTLSDASRELIDFRQISRTHGALWSDMTEYVGKGVFDKNFPAYISDIQDESIRINELISNSRELLIDLRETNDSLLNAKQNEIIKFLTVAAFIFYPITFIASLFTIPSPHVPLIDESYGWWVLIVVMSLVVFAIWYIFKKKRWI